VGQSNQTAVTFEIDDHSFQDIKPTDLIKILSNLIDNAMDTNVSLNEGNRWVRVVVYKKTKASTCLKWRIRVQRYERREGSESFKKATQLNHKQQGK
jgi:hypothetical protein